MDTQYKSEAFIVAKDGPKTNEEVENSLRGVVGMVSGRVFATKESAEAAVAEFVAEQGENAPSVGPAYYRLTLERV